MTDAIGIAMVGAGQLGPELARDATAAPAPGRLVLIDHGLATLTSGVSETRVIALIETSSAILRTGGGFAPVEPIMTLLADGAAGEVMV